MNQPLELPQQCGMLHGTTDLSVGFHNENVMREHHSENL